MHRCIPAKFYGKNLSFRSSYQRGALAKACGVPRTRIERLANEETAVTADTALRLGKALGTSAQLWLNLQNDFDMRTAKSRIGKELDKISPIKGAEAA